MYKVAFVMRDIDSYAYPEKVRDVLYKYNKEMKRLQQV